jgi:hypothetical protein
MQHFLKAASGTAWAEVVPAQLLIQFFLAVNDAVTALNLGFRRETFTALAAWLSEKSCRAWQFSF